MQALRAEARQNGWGAASGQALIHVRQLLARDETHTWYERRLTDDGPGQSLPTGAVLVEGGREHLPLIARLPTVSAARASLRLEQGARWWLVLDGDEPLFSCWVFSRYMRMVGAPGGALVLPPDVGFLEDSVTNPARRGAGVGPAALILVAERLREEARWLLTKVRVGNRAADRLVVKAGFVPLATVRIRQVGPMCQRWVLPAAGTANTWIPLALGAAR